MLGLRLRAFKEKDMFLHEMSSWVMGLILLKTKMPFLRKGSWRLLGLLGTKFHLIKENILKAVWIDLRRSNLSNDFWSHQFRPR